VSPAEAVRRDPVDRSASFPERLKSTGAHHFANAAWSSRAVHFLRLSMRVEVRDDGDGFDVLAPAASSSGGLGLVIIDSAASRWGMSDGLPHRVWFELDRADADDDEPAATV
jgi:hypothetical protein